jgi:hypothetical protein
MAQNEMRAMRGMPLRVRSSEGLGPTLDSKAKFLTMCQLQGVTVGIAQECPIAYRRATVFSFPDETAVGPCELAQTINLLARDDTNAQVGKWQ